MEIQKNFLCQYFFTTYALSFSNLLLYQNIFHSFHTDQQPQISLKLGCDNVIFAGTWLESRTRRRSPSHSRWRARASAWRAWRRGPPAELSGARRSADFILILQIIFMSSLLPLLTCFCLHCKVSKYFHRPSTFPMN